MLVVAVCRCIYQCKDTNFKANHNYFRGRRTFAGVVFTNAKILILKLITTQAAEANPQISCIYQCKDTNFKANHNCADAGTRQGRVVFTNAKILILKLITTTGKRAPLLRLLYLPMQRY